MPLLDHFHPPLSERRHWEAFHAQLASCIATQLNGDLPEDYFAEPQVHAGPRIEVDVATFGEAGRDDGGGVATLPQTKTLAPADLELAFVYPPSFGVRVIETSSGPTLVAAIELVSPANKDRPETRQAFAAKCAAYLHAGVGLIVLDIVTNRQSRPFEDLLAQLEPDRSCPDAGPLTAVSYRPLRQGDRDSLELRIRSLSVSNELPTLPLALDLGQWIMVDFEAAYDEACSHSRL